MRGLSGSRRTTIILERSGNLALPFFGFLNVEAEAQPQNVASAWLRAWKTDLLWRWRTGAGASSWFTQAPVSS
jgi:hypothetical protein